MKDSKLGHLLKFAYLDKLASAQIEHASIKDVFVRFESNMLRVYSMILLPVHVEGLTVLQHESLWKAQQELNVVTDNIDYTTPEGKRVRERADEFFKDRCGHLEVVAQLAA